MCECSNFKRNVEKFNEPLCIHELDRYLNMHKIGQGFWVFLKRKYPCSFNTLRVMGPKIETVTAPPDDVVGWFRIPWQRGDHLLVWKYNHLWKNGQVRGKMVLDRPLQCSALFRKRKDKLLLLDEHIHCRFETETKLEPLTRNEIPRRKALLISFKRGFLDPLVLYDPRKGTSSSQKPTVGRTPSPI